ncbi:MAG TPA: hypothetical protein VHR66_32670 [Gemmataceae bacterium]|jgi:hypothetical protein|nr:hypothetical protein [Gemmataceae bacterium]
MLAPFFSLAMRAPARQTAFRRAAVAHLLFLAAASSIVLSRPFPSVMQAFAYGMLGAGIVEGAVLFGWRLTQLPKSQALEFLLTSPVQPRRLFFAEALVGLGRLTLIQLSGVPALLPLVVAGILNPTDVFVVVVMPLTWGIVAGSGLTVWTYETRLIRRLGEFAALISILVYLTVGVLAGEHLKAWLDALPSWLSDPLFDAFRALHTFNPFAVMAFWFDPIFGVPVVARERAVLVGGIGLGLASILFARGASRLKGHFHDRHYRPIDSTRAELTERIGERPLSWWAVRRVMEYSGRVNIWLAGGFGLIYSAYLVAGDHWPDWMGRMVFAIFERMGGAPALVTGMVVLAAVPAAFQYGLWDSTVQDRCRRLELLLLTNLNGGDYWHASLSAAWRRGRGYMLVAMILWAALLISGRAAPVQVAGSVAAGILLWSFSFAVGFGAFSNGMQANGLGAGLTLGLPLIAVGLMRTGQPALAAIVPPGAVYTALTEPPTWLWFLGPLLTALATIWLTRRVVVRCDDNLRDWYDRNQGTRPATA